MSQAWKIVLVLTFARMTMGFQFQSVPALAFDLTGAGGMSFVALGTLTGAYLLPGAAVALAGGWLGQRIGDARVAFCGLAMMAAGGFLGWLSSSFEAMLVWRVFAGIGAVALNVLLTKMAADWFESRGDLPSAMGVLVSSWPAGIALATIGLPVISALYGASVALLVAPALCGAGLLALLLVWREPSRSTAAPTLAAGKRMTGLEWVRVCLAGSIWGIYNTALIGAIAWTPGLLETGGIPAVTATALTSFIGWAAIFSVAAGGWLASRAASPDLPALGCFVLSAILIGALPWMGSWAASVWVMIGVGLFIGPAAAMVMTLPVVAARAQVRAMAMGIYFAIYYAFMGIGPAIFGALRDWTDAAGAPLIAAAVMLLLCLPLWGAFRTLQARSAHSD